MTSSHNFWRESSAAEGDAEGEEEVEDEDEDEDEDDAEDEEDGLRAKKTTTF